MTGTGGGGAPTCPANATFCSGFEATALPTGAIYMVNAAPGDWSRDFAVDTAQKNSGNSSLRVKSASSETGTSGSAYKMLAVPATPNAFWVRFFMRSDMPIGMAEHNVFAGASIGSGPNDGTVEFAEDVGVSFNTSDDVRWPTGYGRLSGGGTMPVLAAGLDLALHRDLVRRHGPRPAAVRRRQPADQRHQLPVGDPGVHVLQVRLQPAARPGARDLVRRRRGRADAHRRLQLS